MTITPGPGYMIDPNNPNGVVPIGSASSTSGGANPSIVGNAVIPQAAQPVVQQPAQTPPAALANPNAVNPLTGGYQAKPAPISNPLTPPTTTGAFTPPAATAPTMADQFNTSLAGTLQSQRDQLANAYKTQAANYQQQIDALKQQNSDAQQAQELGLASEQSTIGQETQAKQAALDEEKQQFEANYQARQALTGRLETLLTTGQQLIEEQRNTTGLASIMNPRLSKTMADVQGEAGVITATLSAYDTQIGIAQNQLKTSLDAITSIYGDQISYWQNVISFYNDREKTNDAQIASLSKDEQAYVDAQIGILQDNISNTQQTAQLVQKAMLDPQTALAYAQAGVSLTDSPAQINQKLAMYAQAQAKASGTLWSKPVLLGGDYVQYNAQTGESRTVVSNATTAGGSTSTSSPTPLKFTTTQLNKGAATSGLSAGEFGALAPDVQNFYISNAATAAQFTQALTALKNGGATADSIKTNIDAMSIPDTVKTYLKSQVDANASSSPASDGGFLGNLWGGIKSYLGL